MRYSTVVQLWAPPPAQRGERRRRKGTRRPATLLPAGAESGLSVPVELDRDQHGISADGAVLHVLLLATLSRVDTDNELLPAGITDKARVGIHELSSKEGAPGVRLLLLAPDRRAQALKSLLDALIAPIDVVDAVHLGGPLCHQSGQDERS